MPGSVVGAGIIRMNKVDMVFALIELTGYGVSAVTWQHIVGKPKPV